MNVGFGNFSETVSPLGFAIVVQTHAYSFSGLMIFYFKLKIMSMNLGFEKIVKIVSPTSFEIIARTHARVLYSSSRLMIGHFEEVRLNMNLEIL